MGQIYDPARNHLVLRIRHEIFDVRDQDQKSMIEVRQDLEYLRNAICRAIIDVNFRIDALGELLA